MVTSDSNLVQFSNSILKGFTNYVRRYTGTSGLQDFCRNLQVDEKWLDDDTAWHDAEFHCRYLESFRRTFEDRPNAIEEAVIEFYANRKQIQVFNSLAGLLLTPERLFSKLPEAASRMNTYNTYSFTPGRRGLHFSRGQLIQRYASLERKSLNAHLCDASRASIAGVMRFFGHQILELNESKCIKNGDSHCQYDITWLNRAFLTGFLVWFLLTGALTWVLPSLEFHGAALPGFVPGIIGGSLFTLTFWLIRNRSVMLQAFEFQQKTLENLRKVSTAREVLNQNLLEYQKQMSQAMALATIGEMSFSFLHDMTSPTMLLSFYSEELATMVKNRYPGEEQILNFSNAIEKATGKLLRLQALFRSTAKSSASEVRVEVNVANVIQDGIEVFRPFLVRNQIQCEMDLPSTQISIETYDGCVETIVLNLIQNALNVLVKSPKRFLFITLREVDTGVELKVRDSGPGIPQDRLHNLWERFGSSESSQSKAKGTGFGMYNIKKVVDRIGGTISVESSSDGACFLVELPRR